MVTGVQFPTLSLVPSSKYNYWEDVRDLCKAYGLVLDPWQENVMQSALGERSDGKWASTRVGLSVPRQSGKTALFEARELAGLLLFNEQLLVHSAHLVPTALEGFERIKGYFENYDDLRRKVRRIREANGEQSIEMTTGQRLLFKSRARGGGRGFSADVLLLDEAQILPDRAWAALLPTMSARSNPQAWLAGTPPAPDDDGEAFTRMRESAKARKDSRLCWMEWSVEGAVDVEDRKLWAQANPGMGIRILADAIADEMHSMDKSTFARERLGMWASEQTLAVIPMTSWSKLAVTDVPEIPVSAYGLDMSHERTVSIGVCLRGERDHIEVAALDSVTSTTGVVEWLASRSKGKIVVVVDRESPAASMIPDLKKAGVPLNVTSATDMAKACGAFYDAALEERLTHFDQAPLNVALAGARKRPIGTAGGWGWDRKSLSIDISPLVAVTLARFGASVAINRQPSAAFAF